MKRIYVKECATFNEETDECFILDRRCPQLDDDLICCKYYRDYVHPGVKRVETKTWRAICKSCWNLFEKPAKSKATLCEDCRKRRNRENAAARMRKMRQNKNVTP